MNPKSDYNSIDVNAVKSEEDRLQALSDYEILDTGKKETFDGLTRLASYLCGTKFSAISLIDQNSEWFKSKIGFEEPEIPRNISFCNRAMESDEIFEIQDVTKHFDFHDENLVFGNSKIFFWWSTNFFS